MVIYLDDYRKAQAANAAAPHRYNDEVLCVNWNPAVHSLAACAPAPVHDLTPGLPEDFSSIDADAFLNRVYALATQV